MQLTAVTNSIQIPGCELRKNGLVIAGELTQEAVNAIAGTLLAVEHCAMWWWGDFLCAVEAKHGSMYDEALKVSAYSYGVLRNAKWICSAFELSCRNDRLSFGHHHCALVECDGDAKKAEEWLARAAEEGWSISEMRKAIRSENAEHKDKNPDTGGFNPMAWIEDGKKFWTQTPVEKWEEERCRAFIEDTQWIEETRRRALERIS